MKSDDDSMADWPAPWETREDAMRRERAAVESRNERPRHDWYQDAPEITLPKECLPNWRTVH